MTAKLAAALVFLSQASAGFASSEFMLCFHRDGHIEFERYDQLCCRGSAPAAEDCCSEESKGAASSSCPDDQCKDLPLKLSAPRSAYRPAPALEKPADTLAGPILDLLVAFVPPISDPARPAFSEEPPLRAGPIEQLRTIVLRI